MFKIFIFLATTKDKCDNVYPGVNEFSEEETKTLSTYLLNIKNKLSIYISLHSYGQLIMYPDDVSNDVDYEDNLENHVREKNHPQIFLKFFIEYLQFFREKWVPQP